MSFIWPFSLFLLVLIPALAVLYFALLRRRRLAAQRAGGFGLAFAAGTRKPGVRRHIPPAIFLSALAILIFALARPQATVAMPRVEGTVMLAFDVSGSMAADDLKPTRMEAAKVAARAFVEKQPPSVQVGVAAFSDGGFSVQAPTNEAEPVLAAINRLGPQRGTSLANGILVSLKAIETLNAPTNYYSSRPITPTATPTPVPKGHYEPAVIILLTDGENNMQPDPLDAAQQAADRGIRIFTVGIGSPEGTTLKVNGFTVHTQLDEQLLQQVAETSGGTYFNAQSAEELQAVYDKLSPELVAKPQKMEVTSLFAGAGIFAMLIGAAFSLLWFSHLP
jgi:Ca-activated chloride channel homolog